MHLTARNTNDLTARAYALLKAYGVEESSRNGPVLTIQEPVVITLTHPWERVNYCPLRDANPFFHLMEGLAMLSGFNSVEFLAHFAKNMRNFSDDGERYNAFYGERLRDTWGDQLGTIIRNLKANPTSRQEVALLWDTKDLTRDTKDKACNVLLMFRAIKDFHDIVDDQTHYRLEMTSINRSNDAIWGGVNGANIVHLSMFHEYVAHGADMLMGHWHHMSNNLHVYTQNPQWAKLCDSEPTDMYPGLNSTDNPIVEWTLFHGSDDRAAWDFGLNLFMARAMQAIQTGQLLHAGRQDYRHEFYNDIAVPVFNSWQFYKAEDFDLAIESASSIRAHDDWAIACREWLERRAIKRKESIKEAL